MVIEFDRYGINEHVTGQYVSITKLKRMYLNVKHAEISNMVSFEIITNVFPTLFVKSL